MININNDLISLNSNFGYPDYSNMTSLKDMLDSNNHTDESITIEENCFVFFKAINGSTATSIFGRIKINNNTVSEGHTLTRNYTYYCTQLYPVKKGDVVKVSCSGQTGASLFKFGLRKISWVI